MLDNIMQDQRVDDSLILGQDNDIGQMDVDDLIIEDPGEPLEETLGNYLFSALRMCDPIIRNRFMYTCSSSKHNAFGERNSTSKSYPTT